MGLPISYGKGSQEEVSEFSCISFPDVVLILPNSADPDEMQHYAAFHLNLHCLPKYGVTTIQRVTTEK